MDVGVRVRRLALLGLALGFGSATACLIDIDQRLSCGDGSVSDVEQCDPADPNRGHVEACRAIGFPSDAECDPSSCTVLGTIEQCNACGDGIRADGEECDGADLGGAVCSFGVGNVGCTGDCRLDYSDCPQSCGDSIVSGDEECDFASDCEESEDCDEGQVCFIELGECVADGGGFLPVIACDDYSSEYSGIDKPYSSGNIGGCTGDCLYSRADCSFCGDGELDASYQDVGLPSGTISIAAEVCDGDKAQPQLLAAHCRPLCLEPPFDPNIDVRCAFDCEDDCNGIELPDDVTPGEIDPAEIQCCLGPGSACLGDGVPDLPCCATPGLEKPEGCAWSSTPPIALVCPDF